MTALEVHLIQRGINLNEEAAMSYYGGPNLQHRIPEDKLVEFLQELLTNPQYDDRHLRFCVNNLGNIKSAAARDMVLSKLYDMPQETETFVEYLLDLPEDSITTETIDAVINFLESEYNIYDWQMMWLLIFLSKCMLSPQHIQRIFRIEQLKRMAVNRAILYYMLCSKGDTAIQRLFITKYGQEQSPEVRMAILCGVHNMDKKERNRFYAVAGVDRQTNQLIEILKRRQVVFANL